MDGVVEALHIFDEHNNLILSHTYTGRPLSAAHMLPLYLDQQQQQQRYSASLASSTARRLPVSLVYLPSTYPPTLVFSIVHAANLLFLLTASSEVEPLLALEFLHRVGDALERFLGSPLLASKIEGSYDIVAQLLTEMCDAGYISITECDPLHDLVEVEGLMDRLLGSITLPGKAADVLSSATLSVSQQASSLSSLSSPTMVPFSSLSSSSSAAIAPPHSLLPQVAWPALPWRRFNVRHTSNEMYADIIESLSVTLAPSGRPIAAFAHGSIVFTAKVSGLPDILLTLTGPAGKHSLGRVLMLPVFHPCVRLARWEERPGELSFIPPNGRFLLAAYEADLMPSQRTTALSGNDYNNLRLPVSVQMRTNLGPIGADFDIRVDISRRFAPGRESTSGSASPFGNGRGLGRLHSGSLGVTPLEDVRISVPLPADVRNVLDIQPNRGDVVYNPSDRVLEWQIPSKDIAAGMTCFALRCTVVGYHQADYLDENEFDSQKTKDRNESDDYGFDRSGFILKKYTYEEPYEQEQKTAKKPEGKEKGYSVRDTKTMAQNHFLMPSSASISFSVKGWLASGTRVESIILDPKMSHGLSEGVKPFKGVKYLTVSEGGVELRC